MRRVGRLLGIGLVGQVNAIGFLDDQSVDPSVASFKRPNLEHAAGLLIQLDSVIPNPKLLISAVLVLSSDHFALF